MNQPNINFAPTLFASPNLTQNVDYGVFKQTKEQRSDAITARWQHKLFMLKNSVNPKKHLNAPAYRLEKSIKFNT